MTANKLQDFMWKEDFSSASKLLTTYLKNIPESRGESRYRYHPSQFDQDILSNYLLPNDIPSDLGSCFIARKTKGDGNCLYNAISLAIVGNDSLACDLRLLSAAELFVNAKNYSFHEKFTTALQHPDVTISHRDDIFAVILSESSLATFDITKCRETAIRKEAFSTCINGEWSGLLNIMSLATILKTPIYSIYPEVNRTVRPIINGWINPVFDCCHPSISIMWTRCSLDGRNGTFFEPNHFVFITYKYPSSDKKLEKNMETEYEKEYTDQESLDKRMEASQTTCANDGKESYDIKVEKKRKDKLLDFDSINAETNDLKCGCHRECTEDLNADTIYLWRKRYHSLPQGWQQQTKLLELYRDTASGDCHFIDGHFICRYAWYKILLGISERTYRRMLKKAQSGVNCLSHAELKSKNDQRGQIAKGFINNYVVSVGDFHPENGNVILPPGITLKDIHGEYVKQYKNLHKPIKMNRFYEIWAKDFKHVKHPKYCSMAKCSICVLARELLNSRLQDHVRNQIKSDLHEHIETQGKARESYYMRRDEAVSKRNVTSLIADGMDQSKTNLPHFINNPKSLDPAKLLQTHITGVILHGNITQIFLDINQFPHDTNLTLHCILESLWADADITESGRQLKPKIYIQLDNCGRENKNKYLFGFLALLMKLKKTKEIQVNFLMVGHTHEDIDQRFSVISRRLKNKPARTVPELLEQIRLSMDKKITVHGIDELYNIKGWIEPYLSEIHGHSLPHSFRIFEDRPDHAGLTYKLWPQDEEWKPNGYSLDLFKSDEEGKQIIPTGMPSLVAPNLEKQNLSDIEQNIEKVKSFLTKEDIQWWEDFFVEPSVTKAKGRWLVDQLENYEVIREINKNDNTAVSPLAHIMEKERTLKPVYTGRKRKILQDVTPICKPSTKLALPGHMIVYMREQQPHFGEVLSLDETHVKIKMYRDIGNDTLRAVTSRKGTVQEDTLNRELVQSELVFVLPESCKIPKDVKFKLNTVLANVKII